MTRSEKYWVMNWWVRWLPVPFWVWLSKRNFRQGVVWYQDREHTVVFKRRIDAGL